MTKQKQPKLLAHANLRRPFIVTVSAIAAIGAAACGGSTVGFGGGDNDIVSNPPPPAACPVTPPSGGDACSADQRARRCGYQDCGGTPSITAECESDGTWHVSQMSCNPPPPPPPSCPAAQPVDGTACQASYGKLECGYKDCSGIPAVKAICNPDGTWSVSEHSCNPPPPPPCPTAQPVAGDACNLATWQECGYKDCFGTPAVTAKCLADKTWSVAERSCNPPPPPQPEP